MVEGNRPEPPVGAMGGWGGAAELAGWGVVRVVSGRGRLRPDAIVNVPGQKRLVIDAKVSLNAYQAAFECEDDGERKRHGKRHGKRNCKPSRRYDNRNDGYHRHEYHRRASVGIAGTGCKRGLQQSHADRYVCRSGAAEDRAL